CRCANCHRGIGAAASATTFPHRRLRPQGHDDDARASAALYFERHRPLRRSGRPRRRGRLAARSERHHDGAGARADKNPPRPVSLCCGAGEGDARLVYAIEARSHAFTYIARTYRWDGQEKIGRRSDGANRDMFGALFVGTPDAERIAREFATFDLRDADRMRTDAAVLGWTPANRSARSFDHVVDALAAGQQPLPDKAGYLLRNGGFQGSGRNGSISYPGIPDAHPLRHPFFADLFALYLVRQVSIDLVNAIALARNPRAARLSPEIARSLGVGNSSGQGMCVALQRWPHWVSTSLTVKEAA